MAIFLIILIFLALLTVFYYNGLVNRRNSVQQKWSDIDIVLKKRYDLIPNLVNTVKGYATHEQTTFNQIVEARTRALNADTVKGQQVAEDNLVKSLSKVFALAENYPELKANSNFVQLQVSLSEIEKDIEMAREAYNEFVREYNIMIESFPGNLIADWFKFQPADYFSIKNDVEREATEVKF